MSADTYANNYPDGKYKGNQITQLDAELKDNKGKNGIWHKKGKVQTESVVAKGTHSTNYMPRDTEDHKVGARLCFSCQSLTHMLKDCSSKAKTKPYQVKACMPLVQVTSENVPSLARVDHSSDNDANCCQWFSTTANWALRRWCQTMSTILNCAINHCNTLMLLLIT